MIIKKKKKKIDSGRIENYSIPEGSLKFRRFFVSSRGTNNFTILGINIVDPSVLKQRLKYRYERSGTTSIHSSHTANDCSKQFREQWRVSCDVGAR